NRLAFSRIVAGSAKAVVRLGKQYLGPDPLEGHHARMSKLPAIEPDIIRSDAGGQPVEIEEFAVEAADLQKQPAFLRVPVKRKEPGFLVESFHCLFKALVGGGQVTTWRQPDQGHDDNQGCRLHGYFRAVFGD